MGEIRTELKNFGTKMGQSWDEYNVKVLYNKYKLLRF